MKNSQLITARDSTEICAENREVFEKKKEKLAEEVKNDYALLRNSEQRSSRKVGLIASRWRYVLCTPNAVGLRGKTNYSNGLQCLYLPCKWCIQRIGTGLYVAGRVRIYVLHFAKST